MIKEIVATKSIMYFSAECISVVDKIIRRNAVVAIFEFLFFILLLLNYVQLVSNEAEKLQHL